MPDWVLVFDSSYPSVDIALPIDDERFHLFVSVRKIEPPPGHGCLQLEDEKDLRTIGRNLAAVRGRAARTRARQMHRYCLAQRAARATRT